jgi:hypothetical protein
MGTSLNLIAVSTALLFGCSTKTELPVETREVVIPGAPKQVICRMQVAARQTRLSFHVGHNQANDVIAFRLIGGKYEVEAVNFTGDANYDFRLYVPSKNGPTVEAGEKTLTRLTEAVSAAGPACRNVS